MSFEPKYTKDSFQKTRTDIISNMLDNPGECEIYPTSKAFQELDESFWNEIQRAYIEIERLELERLRAFEQGREVFREECITLKAEIERLTDLIPSSQTCFKDYWGGARKNCRIWHLKSEEDKCMHAFLHGLSSNLKLKEQVITLREALEWYADESNYTENESGDGYHNMDVDSGQRAREALEKVK